MGSKADVRSPKAVIEIHNCQGNPDENLYDAAVMEEFDPKEYD
jgi:hypothetical protein